MQRLFFLLAGLMGALSLYAQDVTLRLAAKTIHGSQVNEQSWYFQDQEDTIIAVSYQVYAELVRQSEEQAAELVMLSEKLQAQDRLINQYEAYESAANSHIEVQKQMISKADSLYIGYRDLYGDLKKLYGRNTFSLIPGVGYMREGVFGSVGLGYKNLQGHFHFSDDYRGVLVGYRIPLF